MESKGSYSLLVLIGFLALCFGVAFLGSRFPPGEWYAELSKPSWTPPNVLFAPVWTTLYACMALSAWLVWREGFARSWKALLVFGAQLLLNGLWSWLFFGLHQPGWAFAEIVALWCAIFATLVLFWQVRRLAGLLLVPYLLWVSFAVLLNLSLWQLNA